MDDSIDDRMAVSIITSLSITFASDIICRISIIMSKIWPFEEAPKPLVCVLRLLRCNCTKIIVAPIFENEVVTLLVCLIKAEL